MHNSLSTETDSNRSGVRVGVHLLHHLRGQRQVQAGEAQDHQRRGLAVGHEHAGFRQVRRSAQDLPRQMCVTQETRACDTEYFRQMRTKLGAVRVRTHACVAFCFARARAESVRTAAAGTYPDRGSLSASRRVVPPLLCVFLVAALSHRRGSQKTVPRVLLFALNFARKCVDPENTSSDPVLHSPVFRPSRENASRAGLLGGPELCQ